MSHDDVWLNIYKADLYCSVCEWKWKFNLDTLYIIYLWQNRISRVNTTPHQMPQIPSSPRSASRSGMLQDSQTAQHLSFIDDREERCPTRAQAPTSMYAPRKIVPVSSRRDKLRITAFKANANVWTPQRAWMKSWPEVGDFDSLYRRFIY